MAKQKRMATDPNVNTAGIEPIDMNSTSDTRARRLRGKVAPQTGTAIVKGAGASGSAAMGPGGALPGRVQATGDAVLKPANRKASAQKKGARVVQHSVDPNDCTLKPHDPHNKHFLSKQAAQKKAAELKKKQRSEAAALAKAKKVPAANMNEGEEGLQGLPLRPETDEPEQRMPPPNAGPYVPQRKTGSTVEKAPVRSRGIFVPGSKATSKDVSTPVVDESKQERGVDEVLSENEDPSEGDDSTPGETDSAEIEDEGKTLDTETKKPSAKAKAKQRAHKRSKKKSRKPKRK